jgi:hypothetical protein
VSARDELDDLINWYRSRGRDRPAVHVNLARCTCERFCTQLNLNLYYRGHRIIPLHNTAHCGTRAPAALEATAQLC